MAGDSLEPRMTGRTTPKGTRPHERQRFAKPKAPGTPPPTVMTASQTLMMAVEMDIAMRRFKGQ